LFSDTLQSTVVFAVPVTALEKLIVSKGFIRAAKGATFIRTMFAPACPVVALPHAPATVVVDGPNYPYGLLRAADLARFAGKTKTIRTRPRARAALSLDDHHKFMRKFSLI
jgi:hypothetical protein